MDRDDDVEPQEWLVGMSPRYTKKGWFQLILEFILRKGDRDGHA